jgi:cellulose synthase (UDP-forming)
MISGLQPETFASFVLQRVRWAQGMTQIFLLKNPLRVPGLRFWQRLGYLSSSFFWFFGFARIVFILAPTGFLMFGLHVYNVTPFEFLAYAAPHLLAAMVAANALFGKVRWAFVSELYELLQSIFSLPAIVKTVLEPHDPTFKVTPKGERLDEDYVSSLARPFYLIYLVVVASLVAGVVRYAQIPETRDITAITLGWEVLNFVILNAAIGALYERRQRRSRPRMPADLQAQLFFPGCPPIEGRINDLSVGGALLLLSEAVYARVRGREDAELLAYNDALCRYFRPRVKVRHAKRLSGGRVAVGVQFAQLSQAEVADAVAFAHGDSGRWLRFQQSRQIQIGIAEGFFILLRLGTRYAFAHFRAIVYQAASLVVEVAVRAVRGLYRKIVPLPAPTETGRRPSP